MRNTELSSSFDVFMDHCIMSLNERLSPLQFVKQKQHFGLIEHSRDIKECCYRWHFKLHGTSCIYKQLQSVLTNVETIEEADVRGLDRDEEELPDDMIVEQSYEICRVVSDIDAIKLFDKIKYFVFSQTLLLHLSMFCVTFAQRVIVNISQMCRP